MKITFLGTGTSQGVPVIGCTCDTCISDDKRDDRLRSSILITVNDQNIIIDTGPDFRQQMLRQQISRLDAVLLTHEHNDHVIGIDDIRPFNFRQGVNMPVYGLKRVLDEMMMKFAYIFDNNPYPGAPSIICHELLPNLPIQILKDIIVRPLAVMHGNLPILGYRIGNFAYVTDASKLSDETLQQLSDLDVLVLNALQYRKHYSHFTYDEAVAVAKQINAGQTYFTHMSHEMGRHREMLKKVPNHILPAYDGLILQL
ncbi:MAG: MBL fold metallo-hydrolase [Saprospiraceae bacterium]